MIIWVIALFALAISTQMSVISDAEKVGAATNSAKQILSLLFLWFLGNVILGPLVFFTRGKKTTITKYQETK